MASNGLEKRAIKGTCRMCFRTRFTNGQVHAVGEVCHGYATGHIWECVDTEECDRHIEKKLLRPNLRGIIRFKIEQAKETGRFNHYVRIG